MFIQSITSAIQKVDKYGMITKGVRTTNLGQTSKGTMVAIEVDKFGDKVENKTYIFWDDRTQRIFNKSKNKLTHRFERLG